MARYIDADKLIEEISQIKVVVMGGRSCGKTIFAQALNSYRDTVIQMINDDPAADVVPKSEVEKLKAELVRNQAGHPFGMTLFELQACEEHAAITAVKEVWRDLRSMCDAPHWCVWLSEIDDYFEKKTGVTSEDIAELKKKYTGEG